MYKPKAMTILIGYKSTEGQMDDNFGSQLNCETQE